MSDTTTVSTTPERQYATIYEVKLSKSCLFAITRDRRIVFIRLRDLAEDRLPAVGDEVSYLERPRESGERLRVHDVRTSKVRSSLAPLYGETCSCTYVGTAVGTAPGSTGDGGVAK
jgi:hypothetical protein